MNTFIASLDSPALTLENAGGKGYNLSLLVRSGFNVPAGFVVTTDAYSAFVNGGIGDRIKAVVSGLGIPSPEALERASDEIRRLFAGNLLPDDIRGGIVTAYEKSGLKAVAVRSSATTEDLPETSFAGQQETYLNVMGADNLVKAVVECMASLWTGRAIGYRIKNRIPHDGARLAVVIQSMVESEVSGVLFTADPLTGQRSRTVIEAVYGLGESLVSGLSEPDRYVVDTSSYTLVSKKPGRKNVAVRGNPEGGVVRYDGDRVSEYALRESAVLELAAIGKKIEALYCEPQDIEWAYSDGKSYVLQSRPVTTIYPSFDYPADGRLHVCVSFAAVQGFLEPITALGQNLFRLFFVGGARRAGFTHTRRNPPVLRSAGERLWIDITPMLYMTIGRKILLFLDMVEPSATRAIRSILNEPEFAKNVKKPSLKTLGHLARFMRPVIKSVIRNYRNPDKRQVEIPSEIEGFLRYLVKEMDGYDADKFKSIVKFIANLPYYIWKALPLILPPVVSGVAAFRITMLLSERVTGSSEQGMVTSRGVPHNVTTDMDLELWNVSSAIRNDAESFAYFKAREAEGLAAEYLGGRLPPAAQEALRGFIDVYGSRGVGEIDIGKERWSERPEPLMRSVKSYLEIDRQDLAPDRVYEANRKQAEESVRVLMKRAALHPGGFIIKRIVKFVTRRARAFLGFRELPKFFAVRMIGEVRRRLAECGEKLVRGGVLERSDDLFHLDLAELEALANGERRDWKPLVAKRRLAYDREALRRQIPKVLVSDGRAFYEGANISASSADGRRVTGSPVSPGTATGRVRVVLSPKDTSIMPGEVLVCPGTDPSWTPLFLSACALVMEVGGMMTHGAVVAREYGIPAVVGVKDATTVFKTGQLVSVNGSSGEVILEEGV